MSSSKAQWWEKEIDDLEPPALPTLFWGDRHNYVQIKKHVTCPFSYFRRHVASRKPDSEFLIDSQSPSPTTPGNKEEQRHSDEAPRTENKWQWQNSQETIPIQREDLGSAEDFTFVSSAEDQVAPIHNVNDTTNPPIAITFDEPYENSLHPPTIYLNRQDHLSPATIYPSDSVSNLHASVETHSQASAETHDQAPQNEVAKVLNKESRPVAGSGQVNAEALAALEATAAKATEDKVPDTPASTAPIYRSRLSKPDPSSGVMFYPVGVRETIRNSLRIQKSSK